MYGRRAGAGRRARGGRVRAMRDAKTLRRAAWRDFCVALSCLSPALNVRATYLRKFGRLPELKNPETLNEKLLQRKLTRYGADPLVRQCADKLRAREYVMSRGLGETLVPLLGVYDRAEDIDWAALPQRFVLKWNFGSGYNLVCTDKAALDLPAATRQLKKWGRAPFWAYYAELQYRGVHRQLLAEAFIGAADGTPPEDYKFYCFHGRAECVLLCRNRGAGRPQFLFFDRDFRLLRLNRDSAGMPEGFALPVPAGFATALRAAEALSAPFDFVRADLYLVRGRVYFGELTFTPAAGLDNRRLPETDRLFGALL